MTVEQIRHSTTTRCMMRILRNVRYATVIAVIVVVDVIYRSC